MATDGSSGELIDTRADRPGALRRWMGVFACALALYVLTSSRGPQWQDSGEHILRIVNGELVHRLGLALSHPLHYWLGRASLHTPWIEPAFAVTLVSALAGAVAVANVWGCVWTLTRSRGASWLAAGGLGLAHTMWQLSTKAEAYTVTAALFSAEIWCLALFAATRKRNFLWAMFLLNGLGLANHLQAVLTTPILAIVAIIAWRGRAIRFSAVLIGAALWIVGSLPYTGLVAFRLLQGDGHPSAVVYSALFGSSYADEVMSLGVSKHALLMATGFILLNFPNLQLPAFFHGAVAAKSSGAPILIRRALMAALIMHGVFAVRYEVVDQFTFFLPLYVLISVFAGGGYARWTSVKSSSMAGVLRTAGPIFLLLTPVFYMIFPSIARNLNLLEEVERGKPYRDDYVYLFAPWSGLETSAERMTEHAVQLARPNGLILVEDGMAVFLIRYGVQRAALRNLIVTQDVLPNQIHETYQSHGRVVLVPANADAPRIKPPFGKWRRDGDLYVLDTDDR